MIKQTDVVKLIKIYTSYQETRDFRIVALRFSISEKVARRLYFRVKNSMQDEIPLAIHIAQLPLPLSTYDALIRNEVYSFLHLRDLLFDSASLNSLNGFGATHRKHCIEALGKNKVLSQEEYKKLAPVYEFLDLDEFDSVKKAWGYKCATCKLGIDLVQDHWIPRYHKMFPGSMKSNIIPLCHKCNASKNDNDPFMWVISKLGHVDAIRKLREIIEYLEGQL